jgi:hypothetical protein
MFRTAMLSCLVVASSLFAAEPQPNSDQKTPPVAPELKAIIDRLDKIEQSLKNLEPQQTRQLSVWAEMFQKDINELRDWLGKMQRDVNELKAGKGITETLKPIEATGKATLLLVNAHPFMNMDVMVNGAMHPVAPGQSSPVNVPSGNVTFQVMQTDGAFRARSLAPGVTHVVTMR